MKYLNRMQYKDFWYLATYKLLDSDWLCGDPEEQNSIIYRIGKTDDMALMSVTREIDGKMTKGFSLFFTDYGFKSQGVFYGPGESTPLSINAKQNFYDFMVGIFGEEYKKDYENFHNKDKGMEIN